MDFKYGFVMYIGIVLTAMFWIGYFVSKVRKRKFKDGLKIANVQYLEEDSYYKFRKISYVVYKYLLMVAVSISLLAGCAMLACPYEKQIITEEKYSRDIIVCLDISTSVDELNKNLVTELQDTVEKLNNERVGIVIFNTSPVLISPLTNDYTYVIEQLEKIRMALKLRLAGNYSHPDYYYLDGFISDGTLIDNDKRGSSLIGDGLAACINNFSEDEEDRTKIIIFATDNDPNGEGFLSTKEAAALCAENNIIIYGIGTREMTSMNKMEMKDAVESTGGKFYLAEKRGACDEIVDEIESLTASKVPGKTYVVEENYPKTPFVVFLISMSFVTILICLLKR